MTLGLALAVLASAVLHALWNSFVKVGRDRLATVVAILVTGGVVSAPFAAMSPLPNPESLPFLAGSLVTHLIYYYFLVNAYRFGDLSRVYPLARGMAPALVAAGAAVVAGELISAREIAGIALVSCGIASLVLGAGGGAAAGVSRLGLVYAVATGLMIAVYTIIDGMGARRAGTVLNYILYLNVVEALAIVAVAFARRGPRLWRPLRAALPRGVIAGVMATLGYGIVIYAMSRGALAHVSALRETSVVIAALIGTLVLGEPGAARRIAAAAVVAAGVVVMHS
jgi:drug/metabolite transporter (DMT)-like permease